MRLLKKMTAAVISAALAVTGIPVYSGTSFAVETASYEFEEGKMLSNMIVSENSSASGGYVAVSSSAYSGVSFDFTVRSAGRYWVTVYYINSDPNGCGWVEINGDSGGPHLEHTTEHRSISYLASLSAGKNNITAYAEASGMELDRFTVEPFTAPDISTPVSEPINPNASKNTKSLMAYLSGIYGKKTLLGVSERGDGFGHIMEVARERPAVVSVDNLITPYDTVPKTSSYNHPVAVLSDQIMQNNGIGVMNVNISVPTDFANYTIGENDSISVTAQAKGTDFDVNNIFIQGTKERKYYITCLKNFAARVKPLKDSNISYIFNFLPEHDDSRNWYSTDPEAFKKLWILTYDTLSITYGMNNILWMWETRDQATSSDYYPGDAYVDIIGCYQSTTYYDENNEIALSYNSCADTFYRTIRQYGAQKPVALSYLHGCMTIDDMKNDDAHWLFVNMFGYNSMSPYTGNSVNILKDLTDPNVLSELYSDESTLSAWELPYIIYSAKMSTVTTKAPTTTTIPPAATKAPATSVKTTTTTKAPTTTTKAPTTTKAATTTRPVTTTAAFKEFVFNDSNWGFRNNDIYSTKGYYINSYYKSKLYKGLECKDIESINRFLENEWDGSCYGMAVTSILYCYGLLDPDDLLAGANTLYDIKDVNDDIRSLINYYFLMQQTHDINKLITDPQRGKTEIEKLYELENCLKDRSPTLVTYHYGTKGHAVVAFGIEDANKDYEGHHYNKRVNIYDNNCAVFSADKCIYYNLEEESWYIPSGKRSSYKGHHLGLITDDISIINYNGLNNRPGKPAKEIIPYATIISGPLTADFDIHILEKEGIGNYPYVSDSSDDIMIYYPLSDDEEDDDEGNGRWNAALRKVKAGYAIDLSSPDNVDLSIRYPDSFFNVTASNTTNVSFDPNGCSSFTGIDSDYDLTLVFNDGHYTTDWYKICASGSDADKASLKKADDGFILSASNLRDMVVTGTGHTAYARRYFSTDYTEVLLKEKDSRTIGVYVDTDGDGVYETEIPLDAPAVPGDANGDGVVTIADATTILQAVGNPDKYGISGQRKLNADVDGNDGLSAMDSLTVQMVDARLYDQSQLPLVELW